MTNESGYISDREWHIRPTREQDAPAIAALLNTVFGNWGDQATWSWKYEKPPAPFRLRSAVAEVDGRLVGHYGIVPLEISYLDKRIRGAQAVDAAVSPEYRRQGMMSALAKWVLDKAVQSEVVFIYAFPGLYSLNINKGIGFTPVLFVPEMERVLDPARFLLDRLRALPADVQAFGRWKVKGDWSPHLLARLTRFRRMLLLTLGWFSAPVWHRDNPISDIIVRRITAFDTSFDSFGQVDAVLSLVKDANYLTWRYLQHPDQKYWTWGAYRSADLVGYLVMSVTDVKCCICELAYLPGNEDAVYPLVEAAAQAAQEMGVFLLGAWIPEHNQLHSVLMRNGFTSQYRLHHLAKDRENLAEKLYQIILYTAHLPVECQTQILEDLKFWALSMGDSDLI